MCADRVFARSSAFAPSFREGFTNPGLYVSIHLHIGPWSYPRDRIHVPTSPHQGVESTFSPPLAYLDGEGRPIGYSVDLLQEMERVGGLDVDVVSGYWASLLAQLKDGRIDAIANMAMIDERRAIYDYSIGHARMRAAVYFRKNGPVVDNTTAFRGRTLAMLEGSITTYTLSTHPQWGARVQLFNSYEAALLAVQRKECDAALFLRPLGGDVVEPSPDLQRAFLDDLTYRFHFAVHKAMPSPSSASTRPSPPSRPRGSTALCTNAGSGPSNRVRCDWPIFGPTCSKS